MKLKDRVVAVADVDGTVFALVSQVLNSSYFALNPPLLATEIEAFATINHHALRVSGRFVEVGNVFNLFAINAFLHGPVV